ncbi:MAG: hypothetical protein ACRCX2_33655 [Paraclostridium sp.]
MLKSCDVDRIFRDCLFKEEELIGGKPIKEPLIAEGIIMNVGFNPDSIERNKIDIGYMVDQLPEMFNQGWSFLNMCIDKEERQWTSVHKVMEQLLLLGIAIGRLKYCAPREMWDVLPGGMPYVMRVDRGN